MWFVRPSLVLSRLMVPLLCNLRRDAVVAPARPVVDVKVVR